MKAHEIAIADQCNAEFGAEVDLLMDALRMGIAQVGRQQAIADFTAFLMARGDSRAMLAVLAMTAIGRLVGGKSS